MPAAFIKADGAVFIRHSQLYQLRREVARLLPSLLFHYVYLLRFIPHYPITVRENIAAPK